MVRFEKDKLIIEVETTSPYDLYLQTVHALFAVGWFVGDQDEDSKLNKEFGVLAFGIGQALSEMDFDTKLKIERLLIQK